VISSSGRPNAFFGIAFCEPVPNTLLGACFAIGTARSRSSSSSSSFAVDIGDGVLLGVTLRSSARTLSSSCTNGGAGRAM
jgi:hypothetical protein